MRKFIIIFFVLLSALKIFAQNSSYQDKYNALSDTEVLKRRSSYLIFYDACQTSNTLFEFHPKWNATLKCKNRFYVNRNLRAKFNRPVTLQIININPFKYDVTIDKYEEDIIDTTVSTTIYGLLHNYIANLGESLHKDTNKDSTFIYNILMNQMLSIVSFESDMKRKDCVDGIDLKKQHDDFINTLEIEIQRELELSGGYSAALKKIHPGYAERHKEELDLLLKEFDRFYNLNFTYVYNVPQVKNRDELIFTINIKPKSGNEGIFVKDEEIRIPIRGGFKIDGSLGFFYSTLNSHSYGLRQDSVPVGSTMVNGNRVYKTEQSYYGEFGALALLHFYWRFWSEVNIGASFGVGLNFNSKPQPRYFMGLSALVGRRHRFCISSGAVFGNTEKLMPYINYGSFVPSNNPTTYNSIEFGGFLSLTYNLPIPSRQKVKSEPPPKEEKDDKEEKTKESTVTNTINVAK